MLSQLASSPRDARLAEEEAAALKLDLQTRLVLQLQGHAVLPEHDARRRLEETGWNLVQAICNLESENELEDSETGPGLYGSALLPLFAHNSALLVPQTPMMMPRPAERNNFEDDLDMLELKLVETTVSPVPYRPDRIVERCESSGSPVSLSPSSPLRLSYNSPVGQRDETGLRVYGRVLIQAECVDLLRVPPLQPDDFEVMCTASCSRSRSVKMRTTEPSLLGPSDSRAAGGTSGGGAWNSKMRYISPRTALSDKARGKMREASPPPSRIAPSFTHHESDSPPLKRSLNFDDKPADKPSCLTLRVPPFLWEFGLVRTAQEHEEMQIAD